MLIVATAALAKVRTWRHGARWAGIEDRLKLRGGKAAFVGDDFRFDGFTGEGEGDEDGFAIGAGKTGSAIDGLVDEQIQSCLM
jgi:hypothetical protein